MQSDADGFTPRVWESIVYAKHLLTNNKAFMHSVFCNKAYTHLVSEGETDIRQWIAQPVEPSARQTIEAISPVRLISDIDTLIKQETPCK